MDSDISFNSEINVVCVKATGELNHETGARIAERTLRVIAKHKCNKIFCDYSKMKVTASFWEIYENPILFDLWGIPHNFNIAVIYSQDEDSFKFWEARMQNAGFIVRVFTQEEEALKWLTET
jgi:hypothetical protein